MQFVARSFLALLTLLLLASSAHAAKCTDTSGFDAVLAQVESQVPCASATKHKKYVKDAKKAVGSALSGPARRSS